MDTAPLLGGAGAPSSASFYRRIQRYKLRNGLLCSIATDAVDLVVAAYVLVVVLFLFGGAVDYGALWSRVQHPECPDGSRNTAAVYQTDCRGVRPVDAARLGDMHPAMALAVALCVALWLLAAARAAVQNERLVAARTFYRDKLNIPDELLAYVDWAEIMRRIIATAPPGRTELQVVHSITRYADYETALLNEGVLDVNVWVPWAGSVAYYPESLQTNLRWAIVRAIERPQYGDVGGTAANLAWTLRALALLGLALAPGLLVYRAAHYAFRYADEWRRRPGLLATRQWSPYARKRLRQYSELDDALDRRLRAAHPAATAYIASVTSPLTAVLARGLALVAGGVLAIIVAFAVVYDEEFLTLDITPGRSAAFWTGVAGSVLAAAASATAAPPAEPPAVLLARLTTILGHTPPGWKGTEHKRETYADVARLFPYRAVVLTTDLLSVVLTPWLLWRLAGSAGEIARHIADNTVMCPVAGAVSRHAQFDVAGPKMERSVLAFRETYPSWQPNTDLQRSVISEHSVVLESAARIP